MKAVTVEPPKYEPRLKGSSKSISDEELAAVQRFLSAWIERHCRDADGQVWDQRRIAMRLGITQPEFSSWMIGTGRPGLKRLIQIRRATGATLDAILGL